MIRKGDDEDRAEQIEIRMEELEHEYEIRQELLHLKLELTLVLEKEGDEEWTQELKLELREIFNARAGRDPSHRARSGTQTVEDRDSLSSEHAETCLSRCHPSLADGEKLELRPAHPTTLAASLP